MTKEVYFLGGNDAEMAEIRKMLRAAGVGEVPDKNLAWGARLSEYREELKNLADDVIPVFVELKLDCAYPDNAVIIDHHEGLAGRDRPTSIEQVAERLRVDLDPWQKRVSANDRGYIGEMRRLGASEEEIRRIRAYDKKEQGVTEKDENLAKQSVETHLEEPSKGFAVVKSLTNKTSAVMDLLYGKFKHILIYTPDGQTHYSGPGEAVLWLKNNPDAKVCCWYGGGLPDEGYFGASMPLDEEKVRKEIEQLENSIKSHHTFLFPFKIEALLNKNGKTDVDMAEVFNSALKSGWNYKKFDPKASRSNYNEYHYFHEYVQKALFVQKDQQEVLDLFNDRTKRKEFISYYFERDIAEDDYIEYLLRMKDGSDKVKEYSYRLTLDHLSLRLFETGIGVLTLELLNMDHELIEDVLKINDFCRRVYPQYLDENDGIEGTQDAFFPAKIDLQCKSTGNSIETMSEHKFLDDPLAVADYIQTIIGEGFYQNYRLIPVIDDRMYTVSWYGSDFWSGKFTEKIPKRDEHGYENSDKWYQYVFLDGKWPTCQSDKMKKDLISGCTYTRWVNFGTLYGISRYSLMCLANRSGFSYGVLRRHMETMYYQIAIIVLAQRASILKFSSAISDISSDIEAFLNSDEGSPNQTKEKVLLRTRICRWFCRSKSDEQKPEHQNSTVRLRNIMERVKKLHSEYIRFVNRLWFEEVTPQDQGIEMYHMAVNAMGLPAQIKEIKTEIKELYEFMDLAYEKIKAEEDKDFNKKLNLLNVLAMMFIPATLVTGVWGMNLFFINKINPLQNDKGVNLFDYSISMGFFLLLLVSAYGFIFSFKDRLEKFDRDSTETGKIVGNLFASMKNKWFWIPLLLMMILFVLLKCGIITK